MMMMMATMMMTMMMMPARRRIAHAIITSIIIAIIISILIYIIIIIVIISIIIVIIIAISPLGRNCCYELSGPKSQHQILLQETRCYDDDEHADDDDGTGDDLFMLLPSSLDPKAYSVLSFKDDHGTAGCQIQSYSIQSHQLPWRLPPRKPINTEDFVCCWNML